MQLGLHLVQRLLVLLLEPLQFLDCCRVGVDLRAQVSGRMQRLLELLALCCRLHLLLARGELGLHRRELDERARCRCGLQLGLHLVQRLLVLLPEPLQFFDRRGVGICLRAEIVGLMQCLLELLGLR